MVVVVLKLIINGTPLNDLDVNVFVMFVLSE